MSTDRLLVAVFASPVAEVLVRWGGELGFRTVLVEPTDLAVEVRADRPGKQVLEELGGVNEIVTAKATPEEAEAFRRWLVASAQAAADAAKEGGFLGFGAEQVSAGEQQMLDQVRAVLGMV